MLQQLEEEAAAEKERGQALKQRQELRSQALISVGSCGHAKMEKGEPCQCKSSRDGTHAGICSCWKETGTER